MSSDLSSELTARLKRAVVKAFVALFHFGLVWLILFYSICILNQSSTYAWLLCICMIIMHIVSDVSSL